MTSLELFDAALDAIGSPRDGDQKRGGIKNAQVLFLKGFFKPRRFNQGSKVLTFIHTVTFADGDCAARSRRETKRSPVTPIRPKGWDGTGPSLCCSSSPMSRHRLVVPPRSGLSRAPNKRYCMYEREYLSRGAITLIDLSALVKGSRGADDRDLKTATVFHLKGQLMANQHRQLVLVAR